MTISVLVVEDDAVIAWGIENRLKVLRYGVCGLALTGKEAIQKAVELRPDIVLMDINLGGGMDGIEAAVVIRDTTGIPVVYLTAHSDDATIQRAKITEPIGFVLKPYDDSDLRTAIEIGLHKSRMEQQLRKSQQWLAATLSSIGDGVIAIDKQGCVSFMNRLAEELTGWPLSDAIGKEVTNIFEIVEASTRKAVQNPVLESLTTGNRALLAENTILINRNRSERYIDDSASPIKNEEMDTKGAVLVFRDVTEERLKRERLKQSQSLEAIGRMASGIAHDFNNIMTSIINNAEILRIVDMSPHQRLTTVDQIRAGGNRAALLTQQIVAFSRKQMLMPRSLNLNVHLDSMAQKLQKLLGDDIELIIMAATDACQVEVDPTQLGQVIVNLASNARDAMPNGGHLVIATSITDLNAASLPSDVKPGRYVRVTVMDTGTGMSEKVMEHIFEPFFTTKGSGNGIGLGLSAAYGIIKQSGGHIEVTSEIGLGTRFTLYLPLVSETESPPKDFALEHAVLAKKTILLVDDEDQVRASAKMLLEAMGYSVIDASSGADAVRIAEQYDGTIHLLFTDITMPNMSGRQLAERLSAIRPSMRVLYMSGITDDETVHQNVASERAHFLQKPFSLASLSDSLRNALGSS